MGDMSPLLQKQRQLQEQVMKQEQEQQTRQATSQTTMQQQTQSQMQTQDMQALQQTIAENAYLKEERDDANPAEPDEAREELISMQTQIGLGKKQGINAAHDAL